MYADFQPEDVLDQGDIINNVMFSYISDISEPHLFIGEDELDINLAEPLPDAEVAVLAPAFKSPVMIISQGCDIDYGEYICVARILPFRDNNYVQARSEERKAKYIKEHYLKIGVRPQFYYLQEALDGQFSKSVVSFVELHSIKQSDNVKEYLKRNRILRLTRNAVEDMQFRLSFFFGRFAGTVDDYMLTDAEKQLIR